MSDDQWYMMSDGKAVGPTSHAELLNRIQAGLVNRADLVWQDGFPDWVQAGTIKGLFRAPPPAPSAPRNARRRDGLGDPVANRKMIAQLREDAADTQLFVAESIRVMVRLNPVNVQIHEFLGYINQIKKKTSLKKTARLVREAMESVDLTDAVATLNSQQEMIASLGPELVGNYTKKMATIWPEARQLIRHRWLDDPAKEGEHVRQQFRRALGAPSQDLVAIQDHFRQLREFHPRYHAILTQDSVSDFALGLAAGLLGGELGEIAAQVWDGWRGQSDAEFAQSFGNAVDQFSTAALEFTEKTERAMEPVISAFLKDLYDLNQGCIAALETVIDNTDITPIYRRLHYSDPEDVPDDEEAGNQFLELVLSNLRDAQISARAEANIREMQGIG